MAFKWFSTSIERITACIRAYTSYVSARSHDFHDACDTWNLFLRRCPPIDDVDDDRKSSTIMKTDTKPSRKIVTGSFWRLNRSGRVWKELQSCCGGRAMWTYRVLLCPVNFQRWTTYLKRALNLILSDSILSYFFCRCLEFKSIFFPVVFKTLDTGEGQGSHV